MEPDSATYKKICALAADFKSGKLPSEDEVAEWSGQEWELYLENLPTDVEASQVCILTEAFSHLLVCLKATLLLLMILLRIWRVCMDCYGFSILVQSSIF